MPNLLHRGSDAKTPILVSAPRPAEPAVPRGDWSRPAKPDLLRSDQGTVRSANSSLTSFTISRSSVCTE